MLHRKLISSAILAVVLFTLVALALPARVAYACLPCNCPTNRSLNCFGRYGVYTPEDEDGCSILILDIADNGKPTFAIQQSARKLAKLPENPEENLLVDSYYEISLYKLTSGEYQVNVGPDSESKVFVLNFNGCPADNVYESTFIADSPSAE